MACASRRLQLHSTCASGDAFHFFVAFSFFAARWWISCASRRLQLHQTCASRYAFHFFVAFSFFAARWWIGLCIQTSSASFHMCVRIRLQLLRGLCSSPLGGGPAVHPDVFSFVSAWWWLGASLRMSSASSWPLASSIRLCASYVHPRILPCLAGICVQSIAAHPNVAFRSLHRLPRAVGPWKLISSPSPCISRLILASVHAWLRSTCIQ